MSGIVIVILSPCSVEPALLEALGVDSACQSRVEYLSVPSLPGPVWPCRWSIEFSLRQCTHLSTRTCL